MYWSDWVHQPTPNVQAKIEQADMDGSNRRDLVNTSTHWPNGLSLDTKNNILYWCDAYFDRIESYNLNTMEKSVRNIDCTLDQKY